MTFPNSLLQWINHPFPFGLFWISTTLRLSFSFSSYRVFDFDFVYDTIP